MLASNRKISVRLDNSVLSMRFRSFICLCSLFPFSSYARKSIIGAVSTIRAALETTRFSIETHTSCTCPCEMRSSTSAKARKCSGEWGRAAWIQGMPVSDRKMLISATTNRSKCVALPLRNLKESHGICKDMKTDNSMLAYLLVNFSALYYHLQY